MSIAYTEKVDEVLDTSAVRTMDKKDFTALALAALDQAGVEPRELAEACSRAARKPSKTSKWPEYLEAVLGELWTSEAVEA